MKVPVFPSRAGAVMPRLPPTAAEPCCPLAVTASAGAAYVRLSMPHPCACLKRKGMRAGYSSRLPFFGWRLTPLPATVRGVPP